MRLAAPLTRAFRRTRPIVTEMVKEYQDDRVSGLAAEVAFWAVLSLFPLLIAAAAALGSLEWLVGSDVADRAETQVIEFLQDVLTEDASETIGDVEQLFNKQSTGLLTVSVVVAIWSASRGFAAIIRALDVAYDIQETRSFWKTRAIGLGMALGSVLVGTVMLGMLVVGPLLGTGTELAERYDLGDTFQVLWGWARGPFVITVMTLWAATVLHIAPNQRTPWRSDLPGALLTTALWLMFSFGLRYYLQVAGGSNQVFGVLGGSLITLIWLFLLAVGLLVGGELNAALWRRRERERQTTVPDDDQPDDDQDVPSETVKPS